MNHKGKSKKKGIILGLITGPIGVLIVLFLVKEKALIETHKPPDQRIICSYCGKPIEKGYSICFECNKII